MTYPTKTRTKTKELNSKQERHLKLIHLSKSQLKQEYKSIIPDSIQAKLNDTGFLLGRLWKIPPDGALRLSTLHFA